MSIEPITRFQRFLRVLADSSADMPEPLRNLEKCCCYACGHLDTRPELHTTLEKLIASVRDKSIVPPKPNTRLEKYVAAMAGVWDDELPEPITIADKILFEAASGEDVTLSGNPLLLENCISGKALKALHVYGRSTQDGTPSPDNPVPIVSAGDGGSVEVKATGKNLFPVVTGANVSKLNKPDGGVRYGYVFHVPAESSVTASGNADIYTNCYVGDFDIKTQTYTQKALLISEKGGTKATTLQSGWYVVYVANDYLPMILTKLNDAKIQLEIGAEATAYEPYREQLISLPTPNGLPGIPVESSGNYTDPTGQQWACDEVDLERGVKVQRIARFVINKKNAVNIQVTNVYTNVTVASNARIKTPQKTNGDIRTERTVFCEVLPWIKTPWSSPVNGIGFIENDSVDFAIENSYLGLSETSTIDERKNALVKYFTDNPCQVVYRIATPIETPLTPAELTAYKALTTYAPTTVLQATDGAGLEATYKCNVRKAEKTINDLYAELTAELEA